MFHKPMYSPLSKQVEEYIVRDKYQPLFDKYYVDLVISWSDNHIYSRTLRYLLKPKINILNLL